jgi:hypothetical protein
MPLRFHLSGHTAWLQGFAVNISSGGILFRANQALNVHSPIQFNYDLPDTVPGGRGLTVNCKGEILRAEAPKAGDEDFAFAVKVLEYNSKPR